MENNIASPKTTKLPMPKALANNIIQEATRGMRNYNKRELEAALHFRDAEESLHMAGLGAHDRAVSALETHQFEEFRNEVKSRIRYLQRALRDAANGERWMNPI